MPKPMILATVVLMAFGVIAAQTMTGTVTPVEPQADAETFSPFQRMQNAHGLPVYINGDAI